MNKFCHKRQACKRFWISVGFCMLVFCLGQVTPAFAQDIGSMANQFIGSLADIARFITALSYVAGFGFAGAGILKFKAHKDNPTQIPLGTPVTLLFVGAALIFLPALISAFGTTAFSTTTGTGGVTGVTGF